MTLRPSISRLVSLRIKPLKFEANEWNVWCADHRIRNQIFGGCQGCMILKILAQSFQNISNIYEYFWCFSATRRTLLYHQPRRQRLNVSKLDLRHGSTKRRMPWCIIQRVRTPNLEWPKSYIEGNFSCDRKGWISSVFTIFIFLQSGVPDDDALFKKPREVIHKNTRFTVDPFSKALNKSQIQQAAALNAQVNLRNMVKK